MTSLGREQAEELGTLPYILRKGVIMAHVTIGAIELGQVRASSFAEFVEIAKGRSIISAADWGSDRFELGISGGLMIRVLRDGESIEINLISTTNPGEMPPWVLTVWAKTKSAYKSLSSVASLVFERGKEAYLRKLEAQGRV